MSLRCTSMCRDKPRITDAMFLKAELEGLRAKKADWERKLEIANAGAIDVGAKRAESEGTPATSASRATLSRTRCRILTQEPGALHQPHLCPQ